MDWDWELYGMRRLTEFFGCVRRTGRRSVGISPNQSIGGENHRMGAVASGMPAPSERNAAGGEPASKKRPRETEPLEEKYDNIGIPLKEALKLAATSKVAIVFSGTEEENKQIIEEVEKIVKEAAPPPPAPASPSPETTPPTCDVKPDAEAPLKIEKIHVSKQSEKSIKNLTLFNTQGPLIYIKGDAIGGLAELKALKPDYLKEWLRPHQYDLIVIGGGSGGLAAAKEAARLGKKVACLDFVKPSPVGTSWGLGGTCVNVGCIPKKLMHQASLLGHGISDAKKFGWKFPEGKIEHEWIHLKDSVQDHIASLNWGYRVQLREKTVTYINSYGQFTGPFEISATNKKKKVEKITADRFLISTGLRPKYPEIPGAKEFTITSDDLFQLPYSPGKTLCVGASYVSLECAGFLHGLGYDVTVMVRSILLRGFDQDMAERIRKHMLAYGLKFESGVPSRIEQITEKTDEKAGLYKVYWSKKNEETGEISEVSEEYNTILMAIGREAMTDDVGLETIGVKRAKSKKVLGRREQSETIPWVYAIGDVLEGTPELTPVAIQAGRVLMRRLIEGANELTEYDQIPTTVFTPLEYGCCGLSEEDSISKYGKDNIIVYHNVFLPLEYTIPERMDKDHCYVKLICLRNEEEKVVGFHILTPNAGEVTQGFGIALKLSAKKADFDRLIGIHPTVAENSRPIATSLLWKMFRDNANFDRNVYQIYKEKSSRRVDVFFNFAVFGKHCQEQRTMSLQTHYGALEQIRNEFVDMYPVVLKDTDQIDIKLAGMDDPINDGAELMSSLGEPIDWSGTKLPFVCLVLSVRKSKNKPKKRTLKEETEKELRFIRDTRIAEEQLELREMIEKQGEQMEEMQKAIRELNNKQFRNDNYMPDDERVEHDAYCDMCDAIVVGNRYRCVVCNDYDLCSKCADESERSHHHAMLKIVSPDRTEVPVYLQEKLNLVAVDPTPEPDLQTLVNMVQEAQDRRQLKYMEEERLIEEILLKEKEEKEKEKRIAASFENLSTEELHSDEKAEIASLGELEINECEEGVKTELVKEKAEEPVAVVVPFAPRYEPYVDDDDLDW